MRVDLKKYELHISAKKHGFYRYNNVLQLSLRVEYFVDSTRELVYNKQDMTVCKVINLLARC